MATQINVRAVLRHAHLNASRATRALGRALEVFHSVEETCTRFDPTSPLMRANRRPKRWTEVPTLLYLAIEEAHLAYERTAGYFDPRVIEELVALGYDQSLAFSSGDVVTSKSRARSTSTSRPPWRPGFRDGSHEVRLGAPVDLGGIGKGLAVRWASRHLAGVTPNYLVEAGGDCYCAGVASDGAAWRVGIEDPAGGAEPLAVLSLSDRAVTTSSVKLRRWRSGDDMVHHLIDPRTGRSGGGDLVAVTVVGRDPAESEVDSKFLFLAGADHIAALARRNGVAALWVDAGGAVGFSDAMHPHFLWQRS